MFENLNEKLETIFKKLKGRGILDEETVRASMKDIRMALLEADVNFRVTKGFIQDISRRATGSEVLDSITPGQQIVKIVHDRLIELMGGGSSHLNLSNRFPVPVMLVGLQGCGKTTTVAKLARYLTDQGRRVSLVSADVYRPAAIQQLRILGEKIGANVYDSQGQSDPVQICVDAVEAGKKKGFDTLIIDTAGRLHIDDELMDELKRIKDAVDPSEILFVADAMTGQDAVSVAERFDELLGIRKRRV